MQIRYTAPRSEQRSASTLARTECSSEGFSIRFGAPAMMFFEENLRPGGTNGYTTSWGTNAHGKLAGVPPSPRR
ncbi:hypothetical protein [Rhodococcus gannanensis]|uniref:Uncharacterized protein n=1 Tax=Rhodococcus gannanensis TaxID=1960308 RepID=A0ABW4PCW9_9NOCA